MFKELRRKDRALTKEEGQEILGSCEYGFLATCDENCQPYVVPVSYAYGNDVIYFHCAVEGHKLENLQKNNKVSFSVVCDTKVLPDDFATLYKSVVVFGKAVEVFGDEKIQGLTLLLEKYSKDFMPEGMKYIEEKLLVVKTYKIEIDHMSAKGRK